MKEIGEGRLLGRGSIFRNDNKLITIFFRFLIGKNTKFRIESKHENFGKITAYLGIEA